MSRIPVALQAVFLASNRGQEVHKPPPGNVASRVFSQFFGRKQRNPRRWFNRKKNGDQNAKESQKGQGLLQKQQRSQRSLESSNLHAGPISEIFIEHNKSAQQRRSQLNRKKSNRHHSSYDEDSATSPATFLRSRTSGSNQSRESFKKSFTPQSYLDAMLQSRGYSITRYHVLHSGYHNKTTSLQQLSYHVHVIDLVKSNQIKNLEALFTSGLSTNPANAHGEGLINLVCRLGATDVLKTMVAAGCDVQVSDDYGRTPMHDACWANSPAFDVVRVLLSIDPCLMLMMDVRGALPLSYIQEKDHEAWIDFLTSIKDTVWPPRLDELQEDPPPLTLEPPNSRPVPNPSLVLPNMFIQMLASGRMSPEEIALLHGDDEDDEDEESDDEDFHFDYIENGSIGRASFGGYTFNFSDGSSDDDSSTASSFSSLESDGVDETDAEVDAVESTDKFPRLVNESRGQEAAKIAVKEDPKPEFTVMLGSMEVNKPDGAGKIGRTSSGNRRQSTSAIGAAKPTTLNVTTDKCPKSVNRTRSHEGITVETNEHSVTKSFRVDGIDLTVKKTHSGSNSRLEKRRESGSRRPLTPATSGTTASLQSSTPSLSAEHSWSINQMSGRTFEIPEGSPLERSDFLSQERKPVKATYSYCTPDGDDGLLAFSC